MSYQLLKGKKGIIFGALDSNSIAWITAERVFEEGGTFVLTNAPIAMRMGEINNLGKWWTKFQRNDDNLRKSLIKIINENDIQESFKTFGFSQELR